MDEDLGKISRILGVVVAANLITLPLERRASEAETTETLASAEDDKLLHEIEAALNRMDDGTFGFCLGCGIEIDIAYLVDHPTATHCDQCSSAAHRDAPVYTVS